MKLYTLVIKRLIIAVFVLFGAIGLVFFITMSIPSDPAVLWVGSEIGTGFGTEEAIEAIRAKYHLNEPLYMIFFHYIAHVVRGDFGVSPIRHTPVINDLMTYLPNSIELAVLALFISLPLGILLGITSALKRGGVIDHLARFISLSGVCVPAFWAGIMLQFVFYYQLGIFPDPGGRVSSTISSLYPLHRVTGFLLLDSLITWNMPFFLDALQHAVMPAITMAFYPTAIIARMTREGMLQVLGQDYIRTARAYGLRDRIVIFKCALKNALIPTISLMGFLVGNLLVGAVVIESVFYWPGIGRYAVESILIYDYPATLGFILIAAVTYVAANLVVDVTYSFLDPRIRR